MSACHIAHLPFREPWRVLAFSRHGYEPPRRSGGRPTALSGAAIGAYPVSQAKTATHDATASQGQLRYLPQPVWPRATLSSDFLTTVVAVLGTTISPYLFFWQASQEVEEMRSKPDGRPLRWVSSFRAYRHIDRITADTWVGMAVSNGVGFFIMLTAAATLHVHHIKIQTSSDAAKALEPIAGHFAAYVFAAGIVGTGMLALPVLAGSAAYGAAGAFRWRSSLALHMTLAREFYAVSAADILGGVIITFMHLDPVKALYWSA